MKKGNGGESCGAAGGVCLLNQRASEILHLFDVVLHHADDLVDLLLLLLELLGSTHFLNVRHRRDRLSVGAERPIPILRRIGSLISSRA